MGLRPDVWGSVLNRLCWEAKPSLVEGWMEPAQQSHGIPITKKLWGHPMMPMKLPEPAESRLQGFGFLGLKRPRALEGSPAIWTGLSPEA